MQSGANGKAHAITPKHCGAETRNGATCKAWAMPNGRCRMHGGKSPGQPIIHGRYSVKHRATLAAKVENFQAAPVDDLAQELAMLRALTDEYLSRFEDGVALSAGDIHVLRDLLESVGRMVERISKIRNSTALTAAEVLILRTQISDWIIKYVPDDRRAEAINQLRRSVGIS